jgi:CRISPR system Cascade subunit CasC
MGSPKTAVYGGVLRARVSSQSWKYAMRKMFREHFDEAELGIRTKKIVRMVADEIIKRDSSKSEPDAETLAENIINFAGVSTTKNEKTSEIEVKALFFIIKKQVENLAELALLNVYLIYEKNALAVLKNKKNKTENKKDKKILEEKIEI